MKVLLNTVLAFFWITSVWAANIYVPFQYSTIQAAINASSNGDVVLIADGIWAGAGNVNLDYGGKAITVKSESNDLTLCVIDCENIVNTRGFYFHNGENATSVIRGVTIKDGNNAFGGGIFNNSSSPTITNCIFTSNIASIDGGGIFNDLSSPTITNCIFTSNIAPYGGGIFNDSSSPIITNCTFTSNVAFSDGGGIFNNSSSPTITNCIISKNYQDQIYDTNSSATVTYSNVQDGYAGTGNIDVDPLFDTDGYHLTALSPCRCMGTNLTYEDYDIEEDKRMPPCIDMGADQFRLKSSRSTAIPNTTKGGKLLKIPH